MAIVNRDAKPTSSRRSDLSVSGCDKKEPGWYVDWKHRLDLSERAHIAKEFSVFPATSEGDPSSPRAVEVGTPFSVLSNARFQTWV
jgi:hypothetical protein